MGWLVFFRKTSGPFSWSSKGGQCTASWRWKENLTKCVIIRGLVKKIINYYLKSYTVKLTFEKYLIIRSFTTCLTCWLNAEGKKNAPIHIVTVIKDSDSCKVFGLSESIWWSLKIFSKHYLTHNLAVINCKAKYMVMLVNYSVNDRYWFMTHFGLRYFGTLWQCILQLIVFLVHQPHNVCGTYW